ncbi:MAG: glycosyltransferase family 4 protein [Burkholderiaceae bacterium]|nr:glycosyltransferase family 4 protein [Burkholderiaceae bacterium]
MATKTAVFTIISRNYGAFAHTLMESLAAIHPEWERHVLLVDRLNDPQSLGGELFSTTLVEELPLPDLPKFLFRYDIMEMNTAAKPWMFAHLREKGYERIVYLDPDILVVSRLVEVERLLDEGAAAVVTPHLTAPIIDDLRPSEFEIMRVGAYNLGFLALGNQQASDSFIKWWQEKLEFGAASDQENGIFTDQKWVDLAPGMFGGFSILRDLGYNVAYWNLIHRPVSQVNGNWFAGGRPLSFFHFSGFNPLDPNPFSKHQNRFTIENIGAARELALTYTSHLIRHGHAEKRKLSYAFGVFDDGVPIPNSIRALYRKNIELQTLAGENPFKHSDVFVNGVIHGMPLIMHALWQQWLPIRSGFPDPFGVHRTPYIKWFLKIGANEYAVPQAFVVSAQATTTTPRNGKGKEAWHQLNPNISWMGRLLIFLHKRATGGLIGPARLEQYAQIKGIGDFLRVGFAQFRRSDRQATVRAISTPLPSIQKHGASYMGEEISSQETLQSPRRRIFGTNFGIYREDGNTQLWMGEEARFVLNQIDSTKLRIRGHHNEYMHRKAGTNAPFCLTVTINDQFQGSFEIINGDFELDIELAAPPTNVPAVLSLMASAVFVPSEIGSSSDSRKLSIQIASVMIGEKLIFSAANPDEVFSPRAPVTLPGVNAIGYARSEHGLGQSIRQFAHALDANEISHAIIDFNVNNSSRVKDDSLEQRIVTESLHEVNVFHINADQMPAAEMHFPSHIFARYNVGYWHWELPKMNEAHLSGFNRLNEIWVPTSFVQDAIAKSSPIPVIKIPHAIKIEISHDLKRANFGLPEARFVFLMMYDFSSYQERKNPQAALTAFDLARKKYGVDATLVIKTQNAQFHEKDVAALRASIEGRSDIIWLNKTLSRQEVYDLVACCDSLISLHRSEGFGLGPAEAMFLGKPVIATNWSGNTEFMRPNNSCPVDYRLTEIVSNVGVYQAGQIWAEPDVEHAAWWIGQIVNDAELRKKLSTNAARTMREEFSPQAIGIKISERLRFIQTSLM